MSMSMSLVLTKPLSTCSHSNNHYYSSLALSSRSTTTFHPLKIFHYNRRSSSLNQGQRSGVIVRSNTQPIPVPPPTPPPNAANSGSSGFPGRKGWIAGIVLSLLLPFLKNKWGPLFFVKNYIDQKLQTVEDVVETLEKVADSVDNAAEDFGKSLPEGSFKNAVKRIEDVAERVELAAHLTDQAIDKIQDIGDEMESFAKSNQTKSSELNEEKIDSKPAT